MMYLLEIFLRDTLYLELMKNKRIKKSTPRQQAAVRYCEQWLYVEFDGDINSFEDCSYFLSLYLDEAKQTERELSCEYEAYIWSLD